MRYPAALLPLLLAACAPLATPARYGPVGGQAAQSTAQPDWGATAAAAVAAAEYAGGQTATAQAHVIATRTQAAAETQSAGTAMYAALGATQTAAAVSVTLQAVVGQWATGTFQAGAATASATAAIPMMTATQAAAVVQEARAEIAWWAWLIFSIGASALVVIIATVAGERWLGSKSVLREAQAAQLMAQISPPIIASKPAAPGISGYVLVMVNGDLVHRDIPALMAAVTQAAYPEPEPPAVIANVTPAPWVTRPRAELIAFLRDAQRASSEHAAHIPSDARMGRNGSAWQPHVDTLKALGLVTTTTGRPANGEHGTRLTGQWTLSGLIDALEHGQFVLPPAPGTTS